MPTRIVVPDAGQTTDEMLLVKWYVTPGQTVAVGDILADLETDKAVAELEAWVAGQVLALLAQEGDTVTVGQTLLWIGAPGESVPADGAAPAPAATAPAPESASLDTLLPSAEGSRLLASPAARTLARERGLALTDLTGSGPEGCLVKRDVPAAPGAEPTCTCLRGTRVPLSPMRRALAARLTESFRDIPQFTVSMDVDMTRALALRAASATPVTVTDILLKAAADTLALFPEVNCRLEADAINYLAEVNVGLAVSVPDGLVVPVLANADRLSLAELAARSRELIASARAGRLSAGTRASFTISNLGMFGVKSFTALINPPEAAILAVGAIEERLVLRNGQPVAIPLLTLTLTCDHRLIDGALAARFLRALRDLLQGLTTAGDEV